METTTTTGSGAFALNGSIAGYRAFSSVCATNDTAFYAAWAVDTNGVPSGQWETGLGTWAAGTLARTAVHAGTNGTTAVDFGVGIKRVALTAVAAAFPDVLPITAGGTGQATAQAAMNVLAGNVTSARVLRGNGTNIVLAQVELGLDVAGTLPVARGGTGIGDITGILKGNGTSAFTAVTAPTGSIVGTTDTQTLASKTLTAPRIADIGDANGVTRLSLNTSGAVGFSSSFGTAGQILTSAGNAAPPTWVAQAAAPLTAESLFQMQIF